MSDGSLVENRINQLTSGDSAYMRQATTRGEQDAARRGLLSSSIATQAVEGARLDRALPIAQQDANTFAQRDARDSAFRQQGALNEQAYGNQANLADQGFGHNRRLQAQGIEGQSRIAGEQFGYNTKLQAQGIQGQSRIAGEQFGYNTRLADQSFGHNTKLQGQQIRGQRDLARDNFGYNTRLSDQTFGHNTKLSAQDDRQQRGRAQQAFGFNTRLADQSFGHNSRLSAQGFSQNSRLQSQQGQIQSRLSAQGFGQQSQLQGQQQSFAADQASRDRSLAVNANYDAQATAIRQNPNLSPAEQAGALQDLETSRVASGQIATRGTALQGSFTFPAPRASSGAGSLNLQDSSRQPAVGAGPGRRWQWNGAQRRWNAVPT